MRYEKEDEEGRGVDGIKDGQQVLDLDASSRNNTPSAQQSNKICSKSNDRFQLKDFKNQHCKMRFNFYSDIFDCFLPLYIQRNTSKNRRNLTTSEKIQYFETASRRFSLPLYDKVPIGHQTVKVLQEMEKITFCHLSFSCWHLVSHLFSTQPATPSTKRETNCSTIK